MSAGQTNPHRGGSKTKKSIVAVVSTIVVGGEVHRSQEKQVSSSKTRDLSLSLSLSIYLVGPGASVVLV